MSILISTIVFIVGNGAPGGRFWATARALSAASWTRPALFVPYIGILPTLGLLLGVAVPQTGDALRPSIGVMVAMLSFGCIATMDAVPPTWREARAAALMAAIPWCTGALVLTGLGLTALPPDLALGAALASMSPVAFGTSARCRHLGLPERPAVWAALAGIALAPLVLPLMAAAAAALAGGDQAHSLRSPWDLGGRALLLGALPAAAAYVLRRALPRTVAWTAPDIRGLQVLALTGLAICGGATLLGQFAGFGWEAALLPVALALGVQVLASAAAAGLSSFGAPGRDAWLRPVLLLASTSRNASFAWAAGAGVLTPRAEVVLAVTLAATFVLPTVILAWSAPRQHATR